MKDEEYSSVFGLQTGMIACFFTSLAVLTVAWFGLQQYHSLKAFSISETQIRRSATSPSDKTIMALSVKTPTSASAHIPTKPVVVHTVLKATTDHADVVIIGSELEGMYLARAATDAGLRVKVLDPKPAAGGETLQGEMFFLDVPRDDHYHNLAQGSVRRLIDGYQAGTIRTLSEFTAYYKQLTRGVPILSDIHIKKVQTAYSKDKDNSTTIQAITYSDAHRKIHRITASYFVDNSDNAALIQQLPSAKKLPGLEALYGSSSKQYQAATYMMRFKNVNWQQFENVFQGLTSKEVKQRFSWGYVNNSYALGLPAVTRLFQATSKRVRLRDLNALYQGHGDVIVNALLLYHVDPSNPSSVQSAIRLGRKNTDGVLKLFQKKLPGFEHAAVNGYPPYLYIREYQHYQADYVLQISDLLSARMFWDNVSIGAYPIDLQGSMANPWGIEMGRPDKYGIPLRSFLLAPYSNVILAGKNVGASAIAYGSVRIQANTALAAQTIGILLGRLQGKKRLNEVNKQDMAVFHQYLANHDHIVLTGVSGKNKIAGMSKHQIEQLDQGQLYYPDYIKSKP